MSRPQVSSFVIRHSSFRQTRAAFTLIELLLVLVILAVLAAIVVPKFTGRKAEADIGAAKAQISNFETALDMFEADAGRYPTTEEGLQALVEKPANVTTWHQSLKKGVPLDSWGNAYQYKSDDGTSYTIWSFGPNGRDEGGSGDDISSVPASK